MTGRGFPANAAAAIVVEKAGTRYSRVLTTVTVNADGSFSASVNIPLEAAKLGELTIRATANGGAVQATQIYVVKAIFTDVTEVVINGGVHVYGVGMPAGQSVRIGVQVGDNARAVTWLSTVPVAGDRTFDATVSVRNIAVGSTIKMVAEAQDGYRVTSSALRVIALPTLSVTPSSGHTNVTVTLHGTKWPRERALMVGKRSVDGKSDIWLRGQFFTDASAISQYR